MTATLHVAALHRYPVKGLSPEPLEEATLSAGGYFPGDRLYAVENGPSGFDPAAPAHQPKVKFLMLMRHAELARLATRYEDETGELVIREGDREVLRADLRARAGRLTAEAFFRRFMPGALRGPPKVLAAPDGFRFTDSRSGFVSLINLASVAAIEDMVGAPVDPLRFRGNLQVTGLPAFGELDLVGTDLVGSEGVRLRVIKRTERCAATNVDPATGERDLAIPKALMQRLGHADCGVYAQVVAGGVLRRGDGLSVAA
ncbi:MOSC domain-containing protein [Methylobacterium sp. JK268]